MNTKATDRQDVINSLANNWEPHDIRDLAATLLRLADSLQQNWSGSNVRSVFRWPTSLARIERNAANLAYRCRVIAEQRERRSRYISSEVLGEPAWDMLLDLFQQYAGGAKVSTTSLCIASGAPTTTALRYISLLETQGYIKRDSSAFDRRVTFVSLTPRGIQAMGEYLEEI